MYDIETKNKNYFYNNLVCKAKGSHLQKFDNLNGFLTPYFQPECAMLITSFFLQLR